MSARWGDFENWFSELLIFIRFPKARFRLFRPSLALGISLEAPGSFWTVGLRGQYVDIEDRRFLPSAEKAETILDSDAPHPRLGEALLAIGSYRPPGGIERIERYCDSADPAIRLTAYGAASWHSNDEAERLVLKAAEDLEAPIRNAANDYLRYQKDNPRAKDWMLRTERSLLNSEVRNRG